MADRRCGITGLPLAAAAAVLTATLAFPQAAAAEPKDADALKRFVHQDCGSCHGLTLQGGLGPELTREALQFYDRDVLSLVILDGIGDTPMPPWRPLLSENEAERIADYLLSGEMK
jgi:cytochrome c55X